MTSSLHAPPEGWPPLNPRLRELMRQGAAVVLRARRKRWAAIDAAGLGAPGNAVHDPVLLAAQQRANRSAVAHWAAANLDRPGERVPPFISADLVATAREMVWRGQTATLQQAIRGVQKAAWRRWMQIAFQLTNDADELQALLQVSFVSVATFNDDCADCLLPVIREAQEARARDTHADRRALVSSLLNGEPQEPLQLAHRLDYALEPLHHAAIVWSEQAQVDLGLLEQAATLLTEAAQARQRLQVIAHAATLWLWFSPHAVADPVALAQQLRALPQVRVAMATGGKGVAGFRRAHLDALAAQQQLVRLHSPRQLVDYSHVQLLGLLSHDGEALQRFIQRTLGDLAHAAPQTRRALRVYLACGCNVAQAAEQSHTHRNTMLRRIDRATALLPQPLDSQRLQVGLALEALAWRDDAEDA
jgi:DNA-binding PucR family transcriptional regulator